MRVDLAVLVVVLIFLSIGWWRGFLVQFLGVAGLVVAWLATPTLSPWIAALLSGRGYSAGSVAVASGLLSFAIVLVLFRIAQSYLPEALERWSVGAKRVDSGLGGVLGGVRGMVFCWVLLSAGLLVEGRLLGAVPQVRPDWRSSRAVSLARQYNIVAEVSLGRLEALRQALARGGPAGGIAADALEPVGAGAGQAEIAEALADAIDDNAAGATTRRGGADRARVDADAMEPIDQPPPAKAAEGGAPRRRPVRAGGRASRRISAELLADRDLRAAAARKDWGALLADRRVEALLADDDALEAALKRLR